MAQVLFRTTLRDFNIDLMNKEIKTQFPAKFVQGNAVFYGFEVDPAQFTTGSTRIGRIYTPRAGTFNLHIINGVVQDSAEPGEIRIPFDPDLTAGQETTLNTLLTDHVVTGTTPRQVAEDLDDTTLDDLEDFDSGLAFNVLATNAERNQWIAALTRQVLRNDKRLDAGNGGP